MRKASKREKARQAANAQPPVPIPAPSPNSPEVEEDEEEETQFPEPDEGEEDEVEEEEEEDEENDEDFENPSDFRLAEEGEEDLAWEQSPEGSRVEKPKIWVRIKSTSMDGMYEIGDDKKTLKLTIKPEDRLFQKKSGNTMCFSFETEGIFKGPGLAQEDVYETVAQELVDNALQGVSGVVVCVGPEQSGKFYSLFGPTDNFQDRGILQRALEDLFAKLQTSPKGEYHIILSMFEVRKDKIRDLITLSAEELTRVGDFGPKGLYFEEVVSLDHALGLVLRGLAGQKLLPCDAHPPQAKYHTLIYVDILAHVKSESWRSRITFAKIASVPSKTQSLSSDTNHTMSNSSHCRPFSGRKDNCYSTDGVPRRCCGGPQGPLAELISVRKDMYFLEQMFTKFYDVQKINEYYHELEKLGMYMLVKPPNKNPSQYFRQSKLAHCLKDIMSENSLVRLILHVRPERAFLQSTLEIMRFAERVRYMPCGIKTKTEGVVGEGTCAEAGVNTDRGALDKIHQDKLKDAFKTAATEFEERLAELEGSCKDQVKPVFDGFKEMWENMLEKEFAEVSPEQGDSVVVYQNEENEESEAPSELDLQLGDSKKSLAKNEDPLNPGERKSKSKRGLKQSVSKGGRKNRAESKANVDDSGDTSSSTGKKKERASKPGSIAQMTEIGTGKERLSISTAVSTDNGINTDMSITVMPVGSAQTLEGNTNANLHFKCKCWQSFAQSEAGSPLIAELGEKQNLLKKYMAEHNDTLQEVVTALSKLVAIELNLNELEPDRRFSDDTDKMNLLTTKEQRMETAAQAKQELKKLQDQQSRLRSLTNAVDSVTQECDKAFDQFCEGSDGMSKVRAPVDEDLELRYGEINRIAKEEAQILIRKAFPSRPPWTMFY